VASLYTFCCIYNRPFFSYELYICVFIVICISSLSYEKSLIFAHSLHIIRVCVCLLFIENNLISQILDLVVVVVGVGSKYSEDK